MQASKRSAVLSAGGTLAASAQLPGVQRASSGVAPGFTGASGQGHASGSCAQERSVEHTSTGALANPRMSSLAHSAQLAGSMALSEDVLLRMVQVRARRSAGVSRGPHGPSHFSSAPLLLF